MRKVVAYEGRETTNGTMKRLIVANALTVVDRQVPIARQGSELNSVIGWADGFERSEEGELSFEIHVDDETLIEGRHAAIFVDDMNNRIDGEIVMITRGVIKEILFMDVPNAWGE